MWEGPGGLVRTAGGGEGGGKYDLSVEFGEARLPGVVKDEDGVDHDFCGGLLRREGAVEVVMSERA